ncbi:hypothetical protein [Guptibacillus hwajinpoensis]|uniref:hypothetical protein n=1 Tax=Guptibacillus hwajinpoensis TaxID=208199 RepID=UPI0037352B6C
MKHRSTFLSVGILCITLLTSCASSDYQNAMDKGIDSIGQQDYHQAAIYFEVALSEQANNKKALTYFEQASQMEEGIDLYHQEKYVSSLDAFKAIANQDDGLITVQKEARKWQMTILDEQEELVATEETIDTINQLISIEKYNRALEEIQSLNMKLQSEDALSYYKDELAKLTERVHKSLDELEDVNVSASTDQTEGKAATTKKDTEKVDEGITYTSYTNERFRFKIEYPSYLTAGSPPTNGDGLTFYNEELEITVFGSHNVRDETIEDIYQQSIDTISVPIAYDRLADNWFVLSYVENGMIIYDKFFYGNDVFNRFIITYPENKQDVYGPVTTHISDTFVPSAN